MHETVLAAKIIKEVESRSKPAKSSLSKKDRANSMISAVSLDIGELAVLPAKELKETLKALVNWKIKINVIKARARCKCGFTGHPKIMERGHDFCLYVCPKCENVPKLIAGNEIGISNIMIKIPSGIARRNL